MNISEETPIIIYTSDTCTHSWAVERFMKEWSVPVEYRNISRKPEHKEQVMELNKGYASVPTLLFPDGTQMTEPSFKTLRATLGIVEPGLWERIKGFFGGGEVADAA